MVDTALLWIGLAGVAVVAAIGVAIWQFAVTGERPLKPLALAAVAFAGVFQLGQANGYFWPTAATVLTAACLLIAAGLVAVEFRGAD
ncbi:MULTISPECIES: hypothetical protein [Halolamina]|uniref:Integral membrane protein n=1 Tax=Halolamina pelagica TaxID=699431 RepID=A0A1I5UYA0_9EURY|nr:MULTISPECIES: hypothetical protein [Halolamina]NHX36838.1 hypothetical protein [Halolamina sp. R1-12]SFP99676.1 hypothetical protein SAMN05216277_11513 [Halolamina pelagica]